MLEISLTTELVQDFDIKSTKLLGIIKTPAYRDLVAEYDLNETQSLLWYDIIKLLNSIMEIYDYEDLTLTPKAFGKIITKLLHQAENDYHFLKTLLRSIQAEDWEIVGTTVWEIIEDIQLIYASIEKELEKIFAGQKEIDQIVKEREQS